MIRRLTLILPFVIFTSDSAPAAAARLTGIVRDLSNAPIADARLTMANPDTSVFVEQRSSAEGTYEFVNVPSGIWNVGASFPGRAYMEVSISVAATDVTQDFSLGLDVHAGRWSTIGNTDPENLYATNSGSLLPDGTILYCHDTKEPVRFNPVTGTKTFPPTSPSQQGCHVTTLLADGRLIFIGGQNTGDFRDAVRTVKTFNFSNNGWLVLPDMFEERWYPGIARLKDGRLLVMGGGQRPNAQRTPTCEIYDPVSNSWTRTGSMSNPSDYPPSVLLHDGRVLRSWWPPQMFDVATGVWTNTGPMIQPNRFWPGHCDHTLVVLPDGRACAVGIFRGSLTSPSMIELFNPVTNTWSLGANAAVTRSQPEVVMLPTGHVFVAGGKLEDTNPSVSVNAWGQTQLTDIYDPVTNLWRRCEDMAWHREYHALTVLVPDGRVITTAGTGGPANPGISNAVEAFEPPYLFRGVRPRIDSLQSESLQNGGSFSMSVSRTSAVTDVVLIGTNATTHWVDGGVPRVVSLPFTQNGAQVIFNVPADMNLAPIGYYMLFVLVDGIPSLGRVVRIDSAASGNPNDAPPVTVLARAWPNPFTEAVEFEWYQPEPGQNGFAVYDVQGRRVAKLPEQERRQGWHHYRWNGRASDGARVPVGVYWFQLTGSQSGPAVKVVRLQ
jgi:hypothetical protein